MGIGDEGAGGSFKKIETAGKGGEPGGLDPTLAQGAGKAEKEASCFKSAATRSVFQSTR